jgi:hypothetical protein
MRLQSLLFTSVLLSGCVTMNMNKEPDRWITVLDTDTDKPVPNLSLLYYDSRKPYFIVSKVERSREYVTDSQGRAHVPSGVYLQVGTPGWTEARDRNIGRSVDDIIADDIYYVEKRIIE